MALKDVGTQWVAIATRTDPGGPWDPLPRAPLTMQEAEVQKALGKIEVKVAKDRRLQVTQVRLA